MGQSPNGSTYSETPCDYILVQGNADLKDGWVVPRIWTSQITKTAKSGDLIMSVRAPAGAIGKTAYDVVIGRGVASINGNEFIYQTLKKYEIEGYWKKIATGSTFESINSEDINDTILFVPIDDSEQKQIGSLFSKLDHLITLHQCKYFTICNKNRFAWEQRKLFDFTFFYNGLTYTPDDVRENGTLVLRSSNVKHSEIVLNDNVYVDPIKVNSEYVKKGDIIIVVRNGSRALIGKHAVIKDEMPNTVIGAFMSGIRSQYSFFVNSLLDTSQFKEEILRNLGATINQITGCMFSKMEFMIPSCYEQKIIGDYFSKLDNLITLHQCKYFTICNKNRFAWEQRKLFDFTFFYNGLTYTPDDVRENGTLVLRSSNVKHSEIVLNDNVYVDPIKVNSEYVKKGDIIIVVRNGSRALIGKHAVIKDEMPNTVIGAFMSGIRSQYSFFVNSLLDTSQFKEEILRNLGATINQITGCMFSKMEFMIPSCYEQKIIGDYFSKLDNLITLHQHKLNILKDIKKYMIFGMLNIEGGKNMPELESIIEKNLIDQLVLGDSQWTYRPDLKSEKDLWDNFRYILEQNNKDRLNGQPLSDNEFEQVKNQLQFSSFYKAGEWLVGENGKVMVHVQRDTEKLHLVVMNHEHIAGGSSVYEVINQYSTLQSDKENGKDNNSRFDVTLMINGLPMIHIELKNKSHPYIEAFNQIKRYIGEGKFTGIFSAVQMFVVSNGVDTKYFSAASDTELNPKFMSGWLDEKNNPVTDYIDFAKSVLSIPQAHEMIARYTVLDEDSKRLILLRPYQIHAIEAIRESSKQGKSGYVWHTTGSGKTLTSYKATRNLLMDIPSIDKTIFLIDRKDLDAQTTLAFQAYANNDLVDVDETENVNDLKKKLKSDDRQVIVTTIQKLQRLVTKRLNEDTPEYNKIRSLKLGFIVD